MLVDLHVHSSASFDCDVEPRQVAERCRKLGLAPIFLTDHDSIAGAEELRKELGDGQVVVGQEIMTTQGELIGLFLKEKVPSGLDPRDAIGVIKDQGGLVYLEHPFDSYRRRLALDVIEELAAAFDVVEAYNARSAPEDNERAMELALTLGVPAGAGSDAHRLEQIGAAYVEIENFQGPMDFLTKLQTAKIVAKPPPTWVRVAQQRATRLFGQRL